MALRIAVLGAGQRAEDVCSHLLKIPHRAVVAAVADPDPRRRELFAAVHGIGEDALYGGWEAFFEALPPVDAVFVATMDNDHLGPAIAALEAGYHLLLEKPMVTTVDDLNALETAATRARERFGTIHGVVHPLRYGESFRALKKTIAEGRIGEIVTLDWMEQVAWWHFAHSYVRGNWRREDRSSFILLAKSCHDIDYIYHLVGRPVERVSSFGSLSYFTPQNAPERAAERCLDCPLEPDCPYAATRWYLNTDRTVWPARAAAADHGYDDHREALRNGPFGRCVWRSDNDAIDHQVVSMEFSGGVTCTFTLSAFTARMARRGHIHGTTGEVDFEQDHAVIRDFRDNRRTRIDFAGVGEGHADADHYIVDRFVRAVETGEASHVTTNIHESAASHRITFAAERARREARVMSREEID